MKVIAVIFSLLMLSAQASLFCYELNSGSQQETVALDDCLSVLDVLLAVNNFSQPENFTTSMTGGYQTPCTWHVNTCEVGVNLTTGYVEGQISRADIAKTAVAILRACTSPNGQANVGGEATTGNLSDILVYLDAFTPKYQKGPNGSSLRMHGLKRSQKTRTRAGQLLP